MEIAPFLIQFAVSLLTIFALAGLAAWLGLGHDPRLADATEAGTAAEQVDDGFKATQTTLDKTGKGALLSDKALSDKTGRIIILKPHGGHFTGRILDANSRAEILPGNAISVDCGEARFGVVTLDIDDADSWARAINALGKSGNA